MHIYLIFPTHAFCELIASALAVGKMVFHLTIRLVVTLKARYILVVGVIHR